MREPVLGLKVAEPSKPMPTRGGVGVVMVCNRSDPAAALPTHDEVYDELIAHERLDADRRAATCAICAAAPMWTSAGEMTRAARPDHRRARRDRRRDHAEGVAARATASAAAVLRASTIRSGWQRLAATLGLAGAGRADRRARGGRGGLRRRAAGAADRAARVRSSRAGPIRPTRTAVIDAIATRACAWSQQGRAAAIVTNPIQKETLYAAGFRIPAIPSTSPSSPAA